jgi:divalent metal cation (Fe/Co/Zn/Cd) transporter
VAAIREARDPALFTVLLEDAAAMAGLVVALAGVALADLTGDPAFDAGASLCIGVLLAAVAGVMAREVHSLMLGESAHPDVERAIRSAIAGGPEVREVVTLRTLALGAGGVLVMLEARLDSATHGGDAARAADAVETRIRAASPGVRHVLVEPEV